MTRLTQKEIYDAYLTGADVTQLYRRRYWTDVALVATALVPTLALGLYVIKSLLGIDIFPGQHVWELF